MGSEVKIYRIIDSACIAFVAAENGSKAIEAVADYAGCPTVVAYIEDHGPLCDEQTGAFEAVIVGAPPPNWLPRETQIIARVKPEHIGKIKPGVLAVVGRDELNR